MMLQFSLGEATRALSQMVLRFAMMLFALLATVETSFSNGDCEYPDYFGVMLVPPESRVGEFRIKLIAPDYRDAAAVQQHLIYSTVWASLLSSALEDQTASLCKAVITQSHFPSLSAVVFVDRSPKATDANRSFCTQALKDTLLKLQPAARSIDGVAAGQFAFMLQKSSSVANVPIRAASELLRVALTKIYQNNSVLHALLSVDASSFQSFDANAFLGWVGNQRYLGMLGMTEVRTECPSESRQGSETSEHALAVPYSPKAPLNTVEISLATAKSTFRDTLRYAVIVGLRDGLVNAPLVAPAIRKYCNREHNFSIDDGSATVRVATMLIRCLPASFYGLDSWTLFFCEPAGDVSENVVRQAMTALANDPDVLALAGNDAVKEQPMGPYLVSVQPIAE